MPGVSPTLVRCHVHNNQLRGCWNPPASCWRRGGWRWRAFSQGVLAASLGLGTDSRPMSKAKIKTSSKPYSLPIILRSLSRSLSCAAQTSVPGKSLGTRLKANSGSQVILRPLWCEPHSPKSYHPESTFIFQVFEFQKNRNSISLCSVQISPSSDITRTCTCGISAQWEKGRLYNKWWWHNCLSSWKKIKLDVSPICYKSMLYSDST